MLVVSSPLTSAAFAKHLGKAEEKASARVREFLIDSNEEAIHDLRVSIRRLDASLRLIPNNIRNQQKTSNYRSQYKELFSINSEVRDFDIISSKLKKYPVRVTLDRAKSLEQELQEQRSEKLKEARENALLTNDLQPLQIDENDISSRKVQQRFQKVVIRFATRIDLRMPIVASDIGKVKELHELRKDCKKLRYTLEVLNSQARQNSVVSSLIEYLESVQDVLGSIHDCDIMIQYLKTAYSNYLTSGGEVSNYHAMVQLEQKERESLYHAFLDLYSDYIAEDGNKDKKSDLDLPPYSGRKMIKLAATP